MLLEQIFYGCFWISAISILWFYTDWFVYYAELLGIFGNIRREYATYIANNPDSFFSSFLYIYTINNSNKIYRFIFKLLDCPFCLILWLSLIWCLCISQLKLLGPIYVISLSIVLKIRNLFYNN